MKNRNMKKFAFGLDTTLYNLNSFELPNTMNAVRVSRELTRAWISVTGNAKRELKVNSASPVTLRYILYYKIK